jgi:hypothetical protein
MHRQAFFDEQLAEASERLSLHWGWNNASVMLTIPALSPHKALPAFPV